MRPHNTEKLNTECLPRKRNETQDVVANCQVSGPEVCGLSGGDLRSLIPVMLESLEHCALPCQPWPHNFLQGQS